PPRQARLPLPPGARARRVPPAARPGRARHRPLLRRRVLRRAARLAAAGARAGRGALPGGPLADLGAGGALARPPAPALRGRRPRRDAAGLAPPLRPRLPGAVVGARRGARRPLRTLPHAARRARPPPRPLRRRRRATAGAAPHADPRGVLRLQRAGPAHPGRAARLPDRLGDGGRWPRPGGPGRAGGRRLAGGAAPPHRRRLPRRALRPRRRRAPRGAAPGRPGPLPLAPGAAVDRLGGRLDAPASARPRLARRRARAGRAAAPLRGGAMTAERLLIVNADDFGQSPGITRGVIEAAERGIVTSASLMVRWPAAVEAAAFARARPGFSLGLHLDLGEWRYRDGAWSPIYRVVPAEDAAAVAAEVARQWDRFIALAGRPPTHLDSHQHVHRDEPLRSILRALADRHRV